MDSGLDSSPVPFFLNIGDVKFHCRHSVARVHNECCICGPETFGGKSTVYVDICGPTNVRWSCGPFSSSGGLQGLLGCAPTLGPYQDGRSNFLKSLPVG